MRSTPAPLPAPLRRLGAVMAGAIALAASAAPARAETDAERKARAEALFQEAVKLVDAGKAAEACPRLEESERLDAGLGTEFRLYDCYERTGRTASAWAGFVELAAKVKKPDQVRKAKARADALEPKLARLQVTVPAAAAALAGLRIVRDGAPLDRAQWGAAVPVDPGSHRVQATADGQPPWEVSVAVETPGATVVVAVPAPASASAGMPARRVAALVVGGAGVAGVVAGGVLGALAGTTWSAAKAQCPARVECSQGAHDESVKARALSFGSTAAFAAGGAAVAAGVILWLVGSPPRAAAGRVWVAPASGAEARGVVLGGTF